MAQDQKIVTWSENEVSPGNWKPTAKCTFCGKPLSVHKTDKTSYSWDAEHCACEQAQAYWSKKEKK